MVFSYPLEEQSVALGSDPWPALLTGNINLRYPLTIPVNALVSINGNGD